MHEIQVSFLTSVCVINHFVNPLTYSLKAHSMKHQFFPPESRQEEKKNDYFIYLIWEILGLKLLQHI